MKILIVVADSLRPDFLGFYRKNLSFPCASPFLKDDPPPTPFFDELASRSCVFEAAFSSAAWTVPSLASLLTGVWAHRLGIVCWEQSWSPTVPTLFHYLRQKGFSCACFAFEPQHLFFRSLKADFLLSSQEPDQLLAWLREKRRSKYVAFIHYWWTHIPYMEKKLEREVWRKLSLEMISLLRGSEPLQAELHRERLKRLYAEAVRTFTEKWLPRFIEASEPDILILTSDHGESWAERFPESRFPKRIFDLHGCHLHDEVLRVPLVIYGPELVPAGRRIYGLVRSIDVLPTVLELAGVRAQGTFLGSSLLDSMEKGFVKEERIAFLSRNRDFNSSSSLPSEVEDLYEEIGCRSLQLKVLKTLKTGKIVLYDLKEDPEELAPLLPEEDSGALREDLRREYLRLKEALEGEIQKATVGRLSKEEVERMKRQLEGLGYI